ncbi:UNVERIFIED_CONTAM: hypothetical protein Sangu_1474600 [Sesamum angustifolium]|uniref:Uncharacterized protein n=1 Tax=Sesamum angustifolium TaxID=2727405 RepID=A0AAW2MP72_9LAMI
MDSPHILLNSYICIPQDQCLNQHNSYSEDRANHWIPELLNSDSKSPEHRHILYGPVLEIRVVEIRYTESEAVRISKKGITTRGK